MTNADDDSSNGSHSELNSEWRGEEGDEVEPGYDFSKIRPTAMGPGERTISTATRLRRQGFRTLKSSSNTFAVRSIRRGSDDWANLLKPFVSDLAFRSVVEYRFQSEVSFRQYSCHAALLFVDLSSYSKITAAIAHRGAHAISSSVNEYLDRLLKIVYMHGGDVVKFAGDAILVVWEGEEEQLGLNLLCAARCVLEMQEKAGSHPVEGTSHAFRIHCGLCSGPLDSEIFAASSHAHMQRLFHSIGGDAIIEIGELVDLAKAGEVCIGSACAEFIGSRGCFSEVPGYDSAKILKSMTVEPSLAELMDAHIEQTMSDRLMRRNKRIEEDFIHPSVLRFLSHGGLSPTHIAQMRNLCVLFIAMTSNGSSVNWLTEVQGILDQHRCPIVQIIDDDKGVHVVCAVNLYESIPETGLFGLRVCRELIDKEVGCAIGMALGTTFCGVTGSSTVACRWDITGPPPVRAARLMQYALANDKDVVIDHSVYNDRTAATQMALLHPSVLLKGCTDPCPVYTLSDSRSSVAFGVLETVHGNAHPDIVEEVKSYITSDCSRCAVLVTGMPLSGKKIVCQQAAGFVNLVPYLHVCDPSNGLVQLAQTIATWFQYVDNDDVKYLAMCVIEHMAKGRWSRAHDKCIALVNTAIQEGYRACFLVDRVQFLDEFSVSIIRECLHGRPKIQRGSSRLSDRSDRNHGSLHPNKNTTGQICFLCVHVELYNWKPATHVVENIVRSHTTFQIPIVKVGEASRENFVRLFRDLSDMAVEERWLDTYTEAAGFCAGYFIERAAAIRNISGKNWSEGKRSLTETTEELKLYIPPGFARKNRKIKVTQVSGAVAMRFSQLYDELPPLFQTLLKVLTIATGDMFFKLERQILWEVLNDLIAEGVESQVLSCVLDEMQKMSLIKIDQDRIWFQSPALADIALDVCTPIQVRSICKALVERLEPHVNVDFRISMILATLLHRLGREELRPKQLWKEGYNQFLDSSREWNSRQIDRWKELFEDEVTAAGYDPFEILGEDFCFNCPEMKLVGKELPLLKIYSGPVAMGPSAHTLSVLCRNTFHEFGVFHGYPQNEVDQLRRSTEGASERYIKELGVVEEFLSSYGLGVPSQHLEAEFDIIRRIATPAALDLEVKAKAAIILQEYVPRYVETRLQRLYLLITKLRRIDLPPVVGKADEPLRRAYYALRNDKSRLDAAQDALMIMATLNWKPKPLPEYLPLIHYQTVTRLTNKTLKRLNDAEAIIFRHQQSIDDLEAFLVITPLLYAAQAEGRC